MIAPWKLPRSNPVTDEEFRWIAFWTTWRRRGRRAAVALAFLAAVAACVWAGYEIGLTRGRGWRGALIDGGCVVVCGRIGT